MLAIHVNVIMGGQLDEHLLVWQPTHHLYTSMCYCAVPIVLLIEM